MISECASMSSSECLTQPLNANMPSVKRKKKAHLFVLCLSLTHHLASLRALFEAVIHIHKSE